MRFRPGDRARAQSAANNTHKSFSRLRMILAENELSLLAIMRVASDISAAVRLSDRGGGTIHVVSKRRVHAPHPARGFAARHPLPACGERKELRATARQVPSAYVAASHGRPAAL